MNSLNEVLYPSVGDEVKMKRTNTVIKIESRVAEGGQGVVFRGVDSGGHDLAVKWYRKNKYLERQYNQIENLTNYSRPHPSFAWPIDIVNHPTIVGFGYTMEWVEARFVSLVEVLKKKVQPNFRTLITIGIELNEAFSALHSRGLCYRDINFGNLLVDPYRGDVSIVDNDNIGSESSRQGIKGTLRFMAPELILGNSSPSIVTDLYSLAVFLFYLFMHGHPLEGQKVNASYTWDKGQEQSETVKVTHFFGREPLFVYDPSDASNRPEYDSPVLRWWDIYPEFFKGVFVKAFTTGLKEPSLMKRVTETQWRGALHQLNDQLFSCGCGAAVFKDFDIPDKRCWNCSMTPSSVPILEAPSGACVLSPGFKLTRHHLFKDFDYKDSIGSVEPHPNIPGELIFRNTSNISWIIEPVGEGVKEVKPGQRMQVRPMKMHFDKIGTTISNP